jgi:hypothetical protein
MREILLFAIWLPAAGMAFAATLWVLMIYKAFAGRVALEVAIKASICVGIGVYLFLPLYQLPFYAFQRSSNAVATAGLCMDGVALIVGNHFRCANRETQPKFNSFRIVGQPDLLRAFAPFGKFR